MHAADATSTAEECSPAAMGAAVDVEQLRMQLAEAVRAAEEARARESQLAIHNRVLVRLSKSLSNQDGEVDEEEEFHRFTAAAAETMDVQRASIWLFNERRDAIRCLDLLERVENRHSSGLELTASQYPVYFRSIEQDRTIAADDAVHDDRTSEFGPGYLVPLGITSMLDAPIRRAGKLVGVICHEHVGPPRAWTLEEQAFAGSLADFVAMMLDAHERRRAEARLATLVRELDHRVKNTLASVLSLAERTIASSRTLHEFGPAFAGRIRALAVAHELLAASNWQGADLEAMIRRDVEPMKRSGRGTIELSGPPLQISAGLAPSLSLMLHELASNATRYGALSAREGVVRITWEQQTIEPEAVRLRLLWVESEGPPVVPPAGRGFGLDLIEGIASHQLRGSAKVIFDRSGITCELCIPLDHAQTLPADPGSKSETHEPIVSTIDAAPFRMDGTRVLLVEDDFLVAYTLSSVLTAAGCDVIGPASTVDEACRLIKLEQVDAAVLDINLSPGTSAPIARSLQYRGCPFLFVTGYSNITMLPDELRGHRVLAKPVDGNTLCAAVHSLTRTKATAS